MEPEITANNPNANIALNGLKAMLYNLGKWLDEYSSPFAILVDAVVSVLDISELLANQKRGTTSPAVPTHAVKPLKKLRVPSL